MHITGIAEQEFYDEEGNRVTISSQHMLSMKHSKPQQELLVQFGIGKDLHSIDKKVTLKLDTGADVNAFNQTTFQKLFPDMALQLSTVVLENFDKTMVKLMGTFKCFLWWKGKIYRIQAEVMDSEDTPNVLSRETTFLMGILKPCFVVKKFQRFQTEQLQLLAIPRMKQKIPRASQDLRWIVQPVPTKEAGEDYNYSKRCSAYSSR